MVTKAERAASAGARVAGRGVGTGVGAALSSPFGIAGLGIAAVIILLVIFRKDIGEFFAGLKFPEFPKIEFPDFPDINIDFPDFPDLPDLPNLCSLFGIGCNGEPEPPEPPDGLPFPPDVEDTGLLTQEERDACKCGTNIIQDIQGDVSETCISPCPEEPPNGGFIGAPEPPEPCVEVPLITGGFFNTCTGQTTPPPEPPSPEPPEPFEPPVELPTDFEFTQPDPSGQFGGGTIFETDICNKSIGQIAIENGISASAAADMKFQACEVSDFDFGTNTGSGFGAGDDPTGSIVTGGATLESEEKKAACVSCELFGLNCPICAGTI